MRPRVKRMQSVVLAATLVLFVVNVADGLQCHEGFNVSISGVPFFFWAEHSCANGSECFIQEVSYGISETDEADFVLRFGGCISESLAPYMACERLYGENSDATADIVFDMLRGLDSRIEELAHDLAVNGQTHIPRFFSRGRDLNEFISGALKFLDSIGYDRSKIEHHFKALVMSIRDGDGSLPLKILSLAEAAKVRNDATERLSRALCRFIRRSTASPLTAGLRVYCYMSPGLIYPLVSRYDQTIADEMYTIMATALENLEVDGQQTSVPESHQTMFFRLLQSTLVIISDTQPEAGPEAYEVTKNILDAYRFQGSSQVHDVDFELIEIISKHTKEMNSLPSCQDADVRCQITNMQMRYLISQARSNEIFSVLFQTNPQDLLGDEELGNKFGGGMELFNNVTVKFIDIWKTWSQQLKTTSSMPNRTPLTDLCNLLQPEVEKLIRQLGIEKNGLLKDVVPDTCYHFSCSTSLCNSHSEFLFEKDGRRTDLHRDEL